MCLELDQPDRELSQSAASGDAEPKLDITGAIVALDTQG